MIGRRLRYFAHARGAPPVAVGTISAAASSSLGELDGGVHDRLAGRVRLRSCARGRGSPAPPRRPRRSRPSRARPRPGSCRRWSRPRASRPSVPSITALATSVASARVGSGAWIIDSSICVAVITNLPGLGRAADRVLLHQRHARDAGLDAVVAARDHHAVGDGDDLVERLVGLDLLDLGDQLGRRSRARSASARSCSMSAAERTNESATKSAPELGGERQVGDVLLGDRGQLRPRVGDVDALARRQRPGGDARRRPRSAVHRARPRSAGRRRR